MVQKIIVVGAGIIGAATAYQLQKAGAEVTIIDAGHANATQASFGWINASFFENRDHFDLRFVAIEAYRDLAETVSIPINWCGCLCWEDTGAAFDAQLGQLMELGYTVEEIDAAKFTQLEPSVAQPPDRSMMFPQEAAVEPGLLAARLVAGAVENGARMIAGVVVDGMIQSGDRIIGVRTDVGSIFADQVLVAAGTATEGLMARVDIAVPMLKRPALMLRTHPVPPVLNHVLVSEIGEVRQLPDGSLTMPAAIAHQRDTSKELTNPPDQEADLALARLQNLLCDIPLSWSHVTIAHRPVPQDGLPIAGHAMEGLYVATMHSGITLGALMGSLISTEMLSGPTNETSRTLAPYRPARFASGSN